MNFYILPTFAFMGMAFFHLSDGTNFEPEQRAIQAEVVTQRAAEPVFVPFAAPQASTVESQPEILLASLETPVTMTDASPEVAPAFTDLRVVTGSSVRMRSGPGTSNDIITSLTRGTEVAVLEDGGNGWVRLQVIETGAEGWMAERLLATVN